MTLILPQRGRLNLGDRLPIELTYVGTSRRPTGVSSYTGTNWTTIPAHQAGRYRYAVVTIASARPDTSVHPFTVTNINGTVLLNDAKSTQYEVAGQHHAFCMLELGSGVTAVQGSMNSTNSLPDIAISVWVVVSDVPLQSTHKTSRVTGSATGTHTVSSISTDAYGCLFVTFAQRGTGSSSSAPVNWTMDYDHDGGAATQGRNYAGSDVTDTTTASASISMDYSSIDSTLGSTALVTTLSPA